MRVRPSPGTFVSAAQAVPWALSALLGVVYAPGLLRSPLLQGDLPGHLEAMRWYARFIWPLPWGWDPRYLLGAPVGVLYPPLFHWLGGALGQVVPVEWGLRWLLLLAIVALPPAFARAARGMGLRRDEAGFAAAAALCVLWLPQPGLGGSLRQTLVAGNAANGFALPLFALFVARLRRAVGRPAHDPWTAALLALIVLSHFLVGAVAGLCLAVTTVVGRPGAARLRRGAWIAGAALLGSAPFLVPFAWHFAEGSPDAIAFSPLPALPEWLALALLTLLVAVGGPATRRVMMPALMLLLALYAARGVVFPLVGAPGFRMEYHRFRLFLYLALVPAVVLASRRWMAPAVRRIALVVPAAAVAILAVAAPYDARGPRPVPRPHALPDLGGRRVLVLASPEAQDGSWHGLQMLLPRETGALGTKGLFVEASPFARLVFEAERAASAPGAHPRSWAIRTSEIEGTSASLASRLDDLGVAAVIAREPVSDRISESAGWSRSDLGEGFTFYLPPASRAAAPVDVDESGSTLRFAFGDRTTARIATSCFSDWRVASGDGRIDCRSVGPARGTRRPALLEITGVGEVVVALRPRREEWAGLALGFVGLGLMLHAGVRMRRG